MFHTSGAFAPPKMLSMTEDIFLIFSPKQSYDNVFEVCVLKVMMKGLMTHCIIQGEEHRVPDPNTRLSTNMCAANLFWICFVHAENNLCLITRKITNEPLSVFLQKAADVR